MAVYARGYRPYRGQGRGAPAWYVIYREGYSLAFKNWGFRIIGLLFVVWFVIWAAGLYFTFGLQDQVDRATRGVGTQNMLSAASQLKQTLSIFYSGVAVLTGLLAILVGAGLISDDLRTRALPLYLVRPIRSWEYVLGKALILPRILVWTCLLPGLFYYLLVGLWQPPGETMSWLGGNLDIVESVVMHFLTAATSYTGLMLLLSARTDRRGAVIAVSAAIIFAGSLLSLIMARLEGLGQVMKYAGLPVNTVCAIARDAVTASVRTRRGDTHADRILSFIPEPDVALMIGVGLLALGLFSAIRRASTVEVSA
ncbi:MAG: ABC transporter permease subunit [Planctomycetota bacterium]|nr:ABC transporter permease subunit [Planctomycetota bacterium]